ncbi:unnamed protein product, partial [Mycena citricolor]
THCCPSFSSYTRVPLLLLLFQHSVHHLSTKYHAFDEPFVTNARQESGSYGMTKAAQAGKDRGVESGCV